MTPVAAVAGMLLVGGALAVVLGLRRSWADEPSVGPRRPLTDR